MGEGEGREGRNEGVRCGREEESVDIPAAHTHKDI